MKKKKMLFFNIECANIFNNVCKMCSFGYVITDEEFNVMEIEDIIINPESKYDPYLFRENSKTRLAYSKKYYNSHHNFKSQFEVIRDILEDDYISVFGFYKCQCESEPLCWCESEPLVNYLTNPLFL